jgi:class 3 adenylate cyclase
LPDLTDQDLEKIGVASLGYRRLLLRAIAELKGVDKTSLPSDAATSAPPTAAKMDSAERRQVTVMFSDLVRIDGPIGARMDPEDLREVISAYQKCVAETVQRFGGFVAKFMGDGVLIYFGYPEAHEDDAERAVRSGLELVTAVGALKTRAPLQTRVGIATGLVVVGDLIGSGEAQERGIVGETPNLAARLQGVAKANSVVIAESTRKLVGNLFELEDFGAQDLKGITAPVRAWAVVPKYRAGASFRRRLHWPHHRAAVLCAFDPIELDGEDLRRVPIEDHKHALANVLRWKRNGIVLKSKQTTTAAAPLPSPAPPASCAACITLRAARGVRK